MNPWVVSIIAVVVLLVVASLACRALVGWVVAYAAGIVAVLAMGIALSAILTELFHVSVLPVVMLPTFVFAMFFGPPLGNWLFRRLAGWGSEEIEQHQADGRRRSG
ncbi:MAG: hypothetical protein C4289_08110 [Chloroflexota bacterium]